jgi:hypothetical protein
MEVRKIPSQALSLSGAAELVSNGSKARTAKFKMVARSNAPVNNPWLGPLIHDYLGMQTTKNRLTIDYDHDKVIGYANHWDTDTGELVASGVINSVIDGDVAQEVILRGRGDPANGIDPQPYEASITYSDASVEMVPEGFSVTVNGKLFDGPIGVVREWSLRGIAVCPYGMDRYTSTEMNAGKTEDVKVFTMSAAPSVKSTPDKQTPNGDKTMSVETTPVETEVKTEVVETVEGKVASVAEGEKKPVEAAVASSETKEAVVEEPKAEVVETVEAKEVPTETAPEPQTMGQRFLKDFGDVLGGKWFALGKTHEQATQLFVQHLSEENAELKQRLASLDRGAATAPVSFSESPDAPKTKCSADTAEYNHLTVVQKAFVGEFELPKAK